MSKERKKQKNLEQFIAVLFFLSVGVVCGWCIGRYLGKSEITSIEKITSFIVLIALMYFAIFIQIVFHELGHLIFALLSGYKFSSIRIMNIMLIKESGSLKLRILTVAGTGGQVLMVPPEMKNGRFPVVLYNLGGSIINILTGLVSIYLHFKTLHMPHFSLLFIFLASSGIVIALINGIPMRMGIIDNDGYNALTLARNKESRRSFWLQLKINEKLANGVRLKDMPDEWFEVPGDEEMKNSMMAVIGVLACNRLMDEHKFDEASKLMERLLKVESSIVGLHKSLLVCDRVFCELIKGNQDVVDEMLDARQRKIMNAMRKFPTVVRTWYVHALLVERDMNKAKEIRKQFDKHTKYYPYPVEIESELELIEIANQVYFDLMEECVAGNVSFL